MSSLGILPSLIVRLCRSCWGPCGSAPQRALLFFAAFPLLPFFFRLGPCQAFGLRLLLQDAARQPPLLHCGFKALCSELRVCCYVGSWGPELKDAGGFRFRESLWVWAALHASVQLKGFYNWTSYCVEARNPPLQLDLELRTSCSGIFGSASPSSA